MSSLIVIVDYGCGNVGSIQAMLRHLDIAADISADPERIRRAEKLIIAGVGSFDQGMKKLAAADLVDVLKECALSRKTPVLGICLGMQLMTRRSSEGILPGLSWLDAETVRFAWNEDTPPLKIPHMGWNSVVARRPAKLVEGLPKDARFYFVHSYHVVCDDPDDVLLTCHYGYDFVAAIHRENLVGVQFHPEKSHRFGMRILQAFAEI